MYYTNEYIDKASIDADTLLQASLGEKYTKSDPFDYAAHELLTVIILHCQHCTDWKNKSPSGYREFLTQTDPVNSENSKYIYDLMINGEHEDPVIHEAIVKTAEMQRKRHTDEGGYIFSIVNKALARFKGVKYGI